GGTPERNQRGEPAVALGGDPGHGPDHGRDVLSEGPGRGLRGRPYLRVLLLRPAAGHHRRHRLPDQSAGDQMMRDQRWRTARCAALLLAFTVVGGAAHADDAGAIVGTWKLVSVVYEDTATKERTPIYGEHPKGIQIATSEGRWLALVTAEGRTIPKTDEEKVRALQTMIAYTGRYRVEEGKEITKGEEAWNEDWVGGGQERA